MGLANLKAIVSSYIPIDQIKPMKKVMFDTLYALLQKEGVQKGPIVNNLFGFIADETHVQKTIDWLK